MKHLLILLFTFLSFNSHSQSEEGKYTVYLFLGEDCKICQYYAPLMNELDSLFSSDSLTFMGLFPNRYSTEKGITDFRDDHGLSFEMKREYYGTKTKAFGVKVVPEVIVYDEENGQVLYKGRIDNSYHKLGRRRQVVTSSELKDVLTQLVTGVKITVDPSPPIGCYITFR